MAHNHRSGGHHHDHAQGMTGRNLLYSIFINIGITAAQAIGGILSGSLALLSDALHNFSDVISLVISYIANKISKKEADFSKTFGYKRAEIIAAFVNAATLIVIALWLFKESVHRFFEPPKIIDSQLVIWLAIVSIVGNAFCAWLLYSSSKDNMNIRSSYLHLLTDMYTSIAVMAGGFVMKYFQIYWIDSLLTFFIAGYLIYMGYDLLKSSFKVLMLFSPDDFPLEELIEKVNAIEGVKNIHHIHIWSLNEHEIHLEAHVDITRDIRISEFDELLEKIEKVALEDFGINHINIQPEYDKPDNKSLIVQD